MRKNRSQNELKPETEAEKTICICYSASSQAFLRAYLNLNGNENKEKKTLAALLMISPGVGMDLNNYMERLMPGSVNRLKSGQILQHPSADPNLNIQVDLNCLEEFVNVSFNL